MFTLVLLISHTLADFILQTSKIVEAKSNMMFKGYLNHGLGLLITSIPLLLLIKLSSYIEVIIKVMLIIAVHLVLDFIKEKLQNHIKAKELPKMGNALLFILDQIMHIMVIILVTSGTVVEFNKLNEWFLDVVFACEGLTYQDLKKIFILLYISFSGAYFIPLIFDIVYEKIENYTGILNDILKGDNSNTHGFIDEVKTGRWIGILERILILIFLYSNQLSSIGFIIAVKSLARFKMMEDKIFSEYYLLGTLFSVVYTFVTYAIFQKVLYG